MPGDRAALLDDVLDARRLEPLFQPVVDLDRMCTVGFEALARGPAGPLQAPGPLFEAARAGGRLMELDWLCREQAVAAARSHGLRHPLSLFINAEPEVLLATEGDRERWAQFADLRCYAEVTERALAAQPAALMNALDQVREQDWGIALDDVGSRPGSLALLPLVQPDVIKLDLSLLQAVPNGPQDVAVARVLHGALAQAAATGAMVVAEGIETEQHLDLARALGAQYGQGYLLGRPAGLPDALETPPVPVPLLPRLLDRSVPPGAFVLVSAAAPTRRVRRESLLEMARQLLAQAAVLQPEPVTLVCVNDPALLPPGLLGLLVELTRLPLMAMVGSSVCRALAPQVRGAQLPDGDPSQDDFDVIVVSPHFAAALVARPTLTDPDWYDAVLTFDRPSSIAAASALVRRLQPAPSPGA